MAEQKPVATTATDNAKAVIQSYAPGAFVYEMVEDGRKRIRRVAEALRKVTDGMPSVPVPPQPAKPQGLSRVN